MISANELRIGNWIRTIDERNPTKGDEIQVTHELLFDIATMERRNIKPPYHWIDLTEDWLLKFDFKKNAPVFESYPIHPYWVNNGVVLFYNEGDPSSYLLGYAEMRIGKYYAIGARWVRDIHSVQNFYFSLTGEELKLKSV